MENNDFTSSQDSKVAKTKNNFVFNQHWKKKFNAFYLQNASLAKRLEVKNEKTSRELKSFFKNQKNLQMFLEAIPKWDKLKNYHSFHFYFHEKGQLEAQLLDYVQEERSFRQSQVKSASFNKLFTSIKKSKTKSFTSKIIPSELNSFNGTFLAQIFSLKNHSAIFIVSRNEFLPADQEELQFFLEFTSHFGEHIEWLLKNSANAQKDYGYMTVFENLPFPLQVEDVSGRVLLRSKHQFQQDSTSREIEIGKNLKAKWQLIDENKSNSELHHQERINLLGELLNTLRHELSNPLFGLKLTGDMLALEAHNQDNKHVLTEICHNVSRCQKIIENFTNLYTQVDQITEFEIKKVLDEALTLAKSEIREIKIKQFYNDDLSPSYKIKSNPTFLVQIFFNLIINAAQAMRNAQIKKGEISFIFEKDLDNIVIKVQDNGPGIPNSIKEKIFNAFYTTKKQGTGLGLSISLNLVKKLGGQMQLGNGSLSGAEFIISIPYRPL